MNLVLNAEHAMPSGGELMLTTRREGAWVVLDVIDTGVGMTEEVRSRIFDAFFSTRAGGERAGVADDPQDHRGPRRHDPGAERARQGVAVYGPAPRERARAPRRRTVPPRSTVRRPHHPSSQAEISLINRPRAMGRWTSRSASWWSTTTNRTPRPWPRAWSGSATTASSPPAARKGLRLIEEQVFDIVITDLIMDGVGGLEVLAKAKRELPDAEVVILTGHSTIKTAVTAMQAGASTYLTKPLDINELRTKADKASQSQRLQRSNIELQKQLNEKFGFEGVIGNSSAMHAVVAKLRQIAPTRRRC